MSWNAGEGPPWGGALSGAKAAIVSHDREATFKHDKPRLRRLGFLGPFDEDPDKIIGNVRYADDTAAASFEECGDCVECGEDTKYTKPLRWELQSKGTRGEFCDLVVRLTKRQNGTWTAQTRKLDKNELFTTGALPYAPRARYQPYLGIPLHAQIRSWITGTMIDEVRKAYLEDSHERDRVIKCGVVRLLTEIRTLGHPVRHVSRALHAIKNQEIGKYAKFGIEYLKEVDTIHAGQLELRLRRKAWHYHRDNQVF